MSKSTLDILVMAIAFFGGLAVSFGNNPLIGVALMIVILTTWNIAPKLPRLIKAKTQNR